MDEENLLKIGKVNNLTDRPLEAHISHLAPQLSSPMFRQTSSGKRVVIDCSHQISLFTIERRESIDQTNSRNDLNESQFCD